jgi:5-formyltetrahydrofolate cyclo-ligase
MKTKADLRRQIRLEKEKQTAEALKSRSQAVWAQVEALPEFRRARTVAAYWSLPDEVCSHEFVGKWAAEKRILLPVMCEENELELREYQPDRTMSEARFRVREPEGAVVAPGEVDLILVPGVAFDRQNHRLGRGKGYYDRLLKSMCARKIGVCFDFQVLEEIPTEKHDVSMDFVVNAPTVSG